MQRARKFYSDLTQASPVPIDAAIFGVNVFNYCDFNLYMQSFGKAVGTSSGTVNQLINLGFRFFSDEDALIYYSMSVGMMYRNVD